MGLYLVSQLSAYLLLIQGLVKIQGLWKIQWKFRTYSQNKIFQFRYAKIKVSVYLGSMYFYLYKGH